MSQLQTFPLCLLARFRGRNASDPWRGAVHTSATFLPLHTWYLGHVPSNLRCDMADGIKDAVI